MYLQNVESLILYVNFGQDVPFYNFDSFANDCQCAQTSSVCLCRPYLL